MLVLEKDVTSDVHLAGLKRALSEGDKDKAERIAFNLSRNSSALGRYLGTLREVLRTSGREDWLLDIVLDGAPFDRLDAIGQIGAFAVELGRYDDFAVRLERIKAAPRFSHVDTRRVLQTKFGKHRALYSALLALKHHGLERPKDPDRLFENARLLSARLDLPGSAMDYLYERRAGTGIARTAWDREVATSFAIHHILGDVVMRPRDQIGLIDPVARRDCTKVITRASNGAIMLLFHAGFSVPRLYYLERVPNITIMASTTKDARRIQVHENTRASLFAALRALMRGQIVTLGPDGQQGVLNASIHVLGREVRVSNSSAFLAMQTKCRILFFSMNRNDHGFVPFVEAGPEPKPNQKEADFAAHLMGFYGERLAHFFSGDPRNLMLAPRWLKVFGPNKG